MQNHDRLVRMMAEMRKNACLKWDMVVPLVATAGADPAAERGKGGLAMPVYEFYCADCHTIFNFLSRRITTDACPACPKCGKPELERQVSLFALSRGRTDEPVEGMPDIEEGRLEKAMAALAGEMGNLDENDPRQMARVIRKLTEATGVDFGSGMEEAIRRLEAGEDPGTIEAEMGDLFDGENPFDRHGGRGLKRKVTPPSRDETLYPL